MTYAFRNILFPVVKKKKQETVQFRTPVRHMPAFTTSQDGVSASLNRYPLRSLRPTHTKFNYTHIHTHAHTRTHRASPWRLQQKEERKLKMKESRAPERGEFTVSHCPHQPQGLRQSSLFRLHGCLPFHRLLGRPTLLLQVGKYQYTNCGIRVTFNIRKYCVYSQIWSTIIYILQVFFPLIYSILFYGSITHTLRLKLEVLTMLNQLDKLLP